MKMPKECENCWTRLNRGCNIERAYGTTLCYSRKKLEPKRIAEEKAKKFLKLKPLKLNLGCGPNKLVGFVNIDKQKEVNPDLVWNVEEGLPFPDNSVDLIYSNHFLEHIDNFIGLMRECWRVLKPNGLFEATVPCYPDPACFSSPFHKRVFTENTFKYFSKNPFGCWDCRKDFSFEIIKLENRESKYFEVTAKGRFYGTKRELFVRMQAVK